MNGMVYAFDAASGDAAWEFNANSPVTGSPLVHDGTIYIATEGGEVFTLDTGGKRGWTETIEGRLLSSPVAANGLILFGVVEGESDEVVVALDANGNQQWAFTPDN
jgi:outer membrane protein assembly factor BamB